MSLDQMIADAQNRAENAETDEERLKASGHLDALTQAKEAGYTYTQDDLNRVDKQNKEALKTLRQDMESTLGTGWEEFKEAMQEVAKDDPDMAPTDPEGSIMQKILGELSERDEAIKQVQAEGLAFKRELKAERLSKELSDHLESLDLQKSYARAAREFISPRLEAIVEKAMQGEDVSEEIKTQANWVKELSPVWFEKPQDPQLPPPLPGRSPNGGAPRQLTDEERMQRSESII
jgi:hypothetical protein